MNIVSFNQIIELNHLLQKKELQCKVHIRDACGAQSFYIEKLGDNDRTEINEDTNEDIDEDIYNTIDAYFQSSKMIVVYRNDKHNFTIQ